MAKKNEKSTIKEMNLTIKGKRIGTRGRIFAGNVVKKFPTRVVIELERTLYVPKYERFHKKKTKLHAKVPDNMNIEVGDYVRIQECRPLSKIIHSVVIENVRSIKGNNNQENKK